MEQKLKEVLLNLGYRLYHSEGYDKETGNYHVRVLHSIKWGPSRWKQEERIENKLLKELTKANISVIKINVNEDRYKGIGATYKKIEDDSDKHISMDVPRNKGYFSELEAYIEIKTQLA